MEKTADPTARFSTYSAAPSEMTFTSIASTKTYSVGIRDYSTTYERLECKRLQEQRYIPSPQKEKDMGKVALFAKVQRALDRRLSGQDAVLRPRMLSEKEVLA